MADNEQEIQGTEQGAENTQEDTAPAAEEKVLTQAELDAILSERIKEVREQSAAELRSVREQAEAAIRGYQDALRNVQQSGSRVQEDDDPAPAGMTRDQQVLWDAQKPMRMHFKRQMQELAAQTQRAVQPILQDSTVSKFFASKPGIPDSVKQASAQMFSELLNDPKNAHLDPQQVISASYIRAMAAHAEQVLSGVIPAAGTKPAPKPQPRVVAPNGSADIGGGTRSMSGIRSPVKKEETWQEIRDQLIRDNKFPEDPL